ncbi:MAG: hypothetical protein NT038_06335 [Euryarchaeota archaeon]|nr:hypothetical protein [Euryarchaeota archaeon]
MDAQMKNNGGASLRKIISSMDFSEVETILKNCYKYSPHAMNEFII